jgi:opacity protein-like surface antigen
MKSMISVFMVIIFSFSLLMAQENEGYYEAGAKGLTLQFNGFSPTSFNGGIGGKYFLSADLALRGGLLFSNARQTLPFQGTDGVDGEQKANEFGIFVAFEKHLNTRRVSPYVGAGLEYINTSTESKTAVQNADNQQTVKNSLIGELGYQGGSTFAFAILFGFEFFVVNDLSLGAEYQLGYMKTSRKDQETTVGNVTVTQKQGSYRAFGVTSSGMLALTFYF